MSLDTLSQQQRSDLKAKLDNIKRQRSFVQPLQVDPMMRANDEIGKLDRLRKILRMKAGAADIMDLMYDVNVAGTFKILPKNRAYSPQRC